MIKILLKILAFKSLRIFGWPKILPMNLTISLTYRCNSRCRTCNIWKSKSNERDLTAKEIETVFKQFKSSLIYLTLSGGEPFLRDDIVEICRFAYKHCRPKAITIPTNCLLSKIVIKKIGEIADSCPETQIIINLSLDGIGKKDDAIRGVKGHFEKTLKVLKQLRKLPYKNLTVGIHTVFSKFNVDNFRQIIDMVKRLKPDSFVSEIAEKRKELKTTNEDICPEDHKYFVVADLLLNELRLKKVFGFERITKAFRIQYYLLVKQILLEKRQIIPCFAGIASCQIAPNGDVWDCCVKSNIFGNLRKENLDFTRIWFSPKAKAIRSKIIKEKCYCPLANASYTNMLFNIRILIKVFLNFIND